MKILSVLLVLAALIFASFASDKISRNTEKRGEIVAVEVQPGQSIREFSISWYPDDHPRALSLKGVQLEVVDAHTADITAVEFDITTILQTALGFAFFAEEGQAVNISSGNLTAVKEAFFAFVFRFYAVFEYVEVNEIPGFQNGTGDVISGLYDLSSPYLPWKDFDIQSFQITGTDGNNYTIFSIACETQDDVFFMQYVVCGTNILVDGNVVTSQSTKLDIAIQWFTPNHVAAAWTTGPSNPDLAPHAHNGLIVAMGAEAEFAEAGEGTGSQKPSLNFTVGGYVAFVEWDGVVAVTDQQGNVTAGNVYADIITIGAAEEGSDMDGDFEASWVARALFFSFEGDRPAGIYWDPTIGAVTPPNATGPVATTSAIPTNDGQGMDTNEDGDESSSSSSNEATNYAPVVALFVAIASLLI